MEDIKIRFQSKVTTDDKNNDVVSAIYKYSKKSDPAIVVIHGFTMRKEDFMSYGDYLNSYGISTWHIDLPYHGERKNKERDYNKKPLSAEEIKSGLEQALSDIVKSSKMLKQIGHKKVGIAGYSLGGILTLTTLGRTKEFERGLVIGAGGDLSDLILNSPISTDIARELKKRGVNYEMLTEMLKEFEPCNYARNIDPNSLLMINGIRDSIVPQKNTELFVRNMKGSPLRQIEDEDHFRFDLTTNTVTDFVYKFANDKQGVVQIC